VSANFFDSNNFIKTLSIDYHPWDISSETSCTFQIDSNGKESIIGDFTTYKELLGKIFKNVYTSPKWSGKSKTSEISFNSEFGVISFKDVFDDDIFIFDSFE
jgi:hypothetical protein